MTTRTLHSTFFKDIVDGWQSFDTKTKVPAHASLRTPMMAMKLVSSRELTRRIRPPGP